MHLPLEEIYFDVYFDIEKAYDTTWRHGILRQLHEYGLRGPLAFFIKNFLKNRYFSVKIGNTFSAEYRQEEGTPQGSVISCTLFIVAINGIVLSLPPNVNGTLYVDDLAIYLTASHVPTAERLLQNTINRIADWAMRHGFRLSHHKTIVVHFSNKKNTQPYPNLTLNNEPVRFAES